MLEFLQQILSNHFTLGLLLGFAGGAFLWIQSIRSGREYKTTAKELESKLRHADETLSRVQRAGEDAHRRELAEKDEELKSLRNKIETLKEDYHKLELKLQKEKSEGSGFLGKVREKIVGAVHERQLENAEVVEAEAIPVQEEQGRKSS